MKGFMICPNCKGNGFTKATMECEDPITVQCEACNSQGEIPDDKFVMQTYEEINWLQEPSTSYYHGPPLDYTLFKNLRIIVS